MKPPIETLQAAMRERVAKRCAQKKARDLKRKTERKRAYMRKWYRGRRVRERREVAELLRTIEQSQPYWD
jgi:hypothetical protein